MWGIVVGRTLIAGGSYALGALRELFPDDGELKLVASIGLGLLVCSVAAAIEYRTSVRPATHVARARSVVLKLLASKVLKDLREKGLPARMNLMVPFRPARWLWTRRFFRIVWFEGMENQPDVNLEFPVSCLIVGECFRERKPVFASRAELEQQRVPWGLRGKVPGDVVEVCCYPVYEPARGDGSQSGRILAVLNLDAIKPWDPPESALQLLSTTPPLRVPQVLNDKMSELARLAGHLVQ